VELTPQLQAWRRCEVLRLFTIKRTKFVNMQYNEYNAYEAILGVFERKILRAIFGPTNDNGEWRIKYNDELCTLYKGNDIVTYIKIN
jgi:hypothetical protein